MVASTISPRRGVNIFPYNKSDNNSKNAKGSFELKKPILLQIALNADEMSRCRINKMKGAHKTVIMSKSKTFSPQYLYQTILVCRRKPQQEIKNPK